MKRFVRDPEALGQLVYDLGNMQQPFTVSIVKGVKRTDEQNDLLHKWFDEIARQKGDETAAEVKAACNLTYGKPIMQRDDADWSAAFGYLFGALSRPAKLKAIRVLDVPFTRGMKVKQLSEYMDQMSRDYREAGFTLTDPEARFSEVPE